MDDAQAAIWYRKAADQGNSVAEMMLGIHYEKGRGVAQDNAQALAWYRKAADQGYVLAQGKLGVVYQQGLGVAQDYAQAIAWYRKAIAQDDANSQAMLGSMYGQGLGVMRDDVVGYALLNLAASSPGPVKALATGLRDGLAAGMASPKIDAGKMLTAQMQRMGTLQALDAHR